MRKVLFITLASLLFIGGVAWASVGVRTSSGLIGVATDIYFGSGFDSSTFDGSIYNAVASGTSNTPTITSGTAQSFTIGTTTPAAANFTTIGVTTAGTGKFTTLEATGNITADKAIYAAQPIGIGTTSASGLLAVGTTGQFGVTSAGTVTTTGNTGLNVATPLYRLAVDGTVYMKPSSLSVAAAGGSRMGLNTDGSIYIY